MKLETINNPAYWGASPATVWDLRFLDMARLVAGWSKDPSTQVGAVITDRQNRVAGVGFNGFPRGLPDQRELLEDRAFKYLVTLHAEDNAILFAAQSRLESHTLYNWPLAPCSRCASKIIQAGIKLVVAPWIDLLHPRWGDSLALSLTNLQTAGVSIRFVGGTPLE